MATMLEQLERMMRGEAAMPAIAKLVGFRLTGAKRGEAIIEMDADPSRHANPMGTLHGGVLCDIADAAMGMSYFSTLEEGESFTTLELKINFLRPVWNDRLIASGRVIQRGKTVGLVECTVTNSKGDRVAHSTSTCLTLRGDMAKGR
jgi:uncharacterized protein (TIGR00369 family)